MSETTSVTVTFGRRVVPVQYEHMEAQVSYTVTVDEAEDGSPSEAAAELLGTAKAQVNAALGKGEKAKVAKKTTKAKPAPEEVTPEASEETEPPEITDAALMAQVSKRAKKCGPKPVKELLAKFDVPRVSEVPQERRLEFLAAIEELEAE